LIATLEAAKVKADERVLNQAFSYIEKSTRQGLDSQVKMLTGQSLWLGVFPKHLVDSFIDEHIKLVKSVEREHLDKIGLSHQAWHS
jgi:hypothetical protein